MTHPEADTSNWLQGKRRIPESDRARFIALMAQPQPPHVTAEEIIILHGTKNAVTPPPRGGVAVVDQRKAPNLLISRAMKYPLWLLSFTAFFLETLWVNPLDANEALSRCMGTNTETGAAVWKRYLWLKGQFGVADELAGEFGLAPPDLLFRAFEHGDPPPQLIAALWAAYRELDNQLRQTKADLVRQSEFVAADGRAPRGSNDTRIALFLLAKVEGVFQDNMGLTNASVALHDRLAVRLKEYQAARSAKGMPHLDYELPDPPALKEWIKTGADHLKNPVRKRPGRPRKQEQG